MQELANTIRLKGQTIALVPTMGFLHDGHLSLIREARKHGEKVVVSIFVNPTQFGPGEDLDAYPKSFEKDCKLAQEAGASIIFSPNTQDLYGTNYQTYVSLEKLPNYLCGVSRPVHFRGVATIVTKLFNIVKPHAAIFGQKDFQQVCVIRQMVKDLNLDIEIIGAPTVREADGLAMSSRNAYLTKDQRQQGLCLYMSLQKARDLVQAGETQADKIINAAKKIITAQPDAKIDYITICDPQTLEPTEIIDKPVLMALAVNMGKARLIDNMILQ